MGRRCYEWRRWWRWWRCGGIGEHGGESSSERPRSEEATDPCATIANQLTVNRLTIYRRQRRLKGHQYDDVITVNRITVYWWQQWPEGKQYTTISYRRWWRRETV